MNRNRLFQALFALLLALALLPQGAGTAEDPPQLILLSPGEGSRARSPIPVAAHLQPEGVSLARIELLDTSGRPIARQLLRLEGLGEDQFADFTVGLPFEIPEEEEPALLTFSLLDPFYRIIALRSARVTLLAGGEAQIQPTSDRGAWVTLTQPQPMDSFTGGQFTVAGTLTPPFEGPVTLELVAEDGRVIGGSQLRVEAPGQALDFEVTLYYYYIQSFTEARLVLRQSESAFQAAAIADSTLIGVAP